MEYPFDYVLYILYDITMYITLGNHESLRDFLHFSLSGCPIFQVNSSTSLNLLNEVDMILRYQGIDNTVIAYHQGDCIL